MQHNKRRMRKGWVALASAVLVVALATGCTKKEEAAAPAPAPAQSATGGNVLVTYKDGGKVTQGEFDTFLNINKFFYPQYAQFASDPSFQQEMMNQYVTFKVLSSRADEKSKAEADKKAKEQMDQINLYFGSQEGGLEKKLKDASLTTADVEQFVKNSMYSIFSMESKVTDQQIKDNYDKKIAQDAHVYDIATVSHILIGTSDPATGKETRSKEDALKRAKEVQDKLNNGGDFVALAKEYSEDPGSKDTGGKYENVEISQWEPSFAKAAAELPLNKVSDPVETAFGYHIMFVHARSSKSFNDVKDGIKAELAEAQLYDFVEKELPGMIQTNNLPKPQPQQPAGGAPASPAPAGEAPKADAPAATPAK